LAACKRHHSTVAGPRDDNLCGDMVTYAYGWPRCMECGHRVRWDGRQPKATRRMPPWVWPVELWRRRGARRRLWWRWW